MKVCEGTSVPGVQCKSQLSRQTPCSKTGVTSFRRKGSALNSTAVLYLSISTIKELSDFQQTATGPSDAAAAYDCGV